MSLLWFILAVAITVQAGIFATSIYLHRGLTHRAFSMSSLFQIVMRGIIWCTTNIVPKEWVAVHRKHHVFSDVPGDPHSPFIEGYWKIMLGNIIFYRREANKANTVILYAKDVPYTIFDNTVVKYLGMILFASVLWFFFGPLGLAVPFVAGVVYIFLSASINAAAHVWGRKTADPSGSGGNLWLLAFFTGGEALHNNHHAKPRSPRFAFRWWEIDPSWPFIKVCAWVRLLSL